MKVPQSKQHQDWMVEVSDRNEYWLSYYGGELRKVPGCLPDQLVDMCTKGLSCPDTQRPMRRRTRLCGT